VRAALRSGIGSTPFSARHTSRAPRRANSRPVSLIRLARSASPGPRSEASMPITGPPAVPPPIPGPPPPAAQYAARQFAPQRIGHGPGKGGHRRLGGGLPRAAARGAGALTRLRLGLLRGLLLRPLVGQLLVARPFLQDLEGRFPVDHR